MYFKLSNDLLRIAMRSSIIVSSMLLHACPEIRSGDIKITSADRQQHLVVF